MKRNGALIACALLVPFASVAAWWLFLRSRPLEEIHLPGHSPDSISFSGDWKVLAYADEKAIRLWSMDSRKVNREMNGLDGPFRMCAISRDGKTLLGISLAGRLMFWDAASGRNMTKENNDDGDNAFALASKASDANNNVGWASFSPNGRVIAIGSHYHEPKNGGPGEIRIADITSGICLKTLIAHAAGVSKVMFSPDGTLLVSCSTHGQVRIWDTTTWILLDSFEKHGSDQTAIAFSHDSESLAHGGGWEGALGHIMVRHIATKTNSMPLELVGANCRVYSIAYSPDGVTIAICESVSEPFLGLKWCVTIWDSESGRLVKRINAGAVLRGMEFSPDGSRLAILEETGDMKIWQIRKRS